MKKQIINITILLAMLAFGPGLQAQVQGGPEDNRGEKIESLRIAFISRELNLSPQEAEKFWPVYNEFRGELRTLFQNFRSKGKEPLSAEQQLDFEQKKLDLKKRYTGRFESCIGKDKVNQLYNLEQKFRDKLREMRDQRQRQGGDMQGPPPRGSQGNRPGGR